ncbi:restriction endonuclease [Myxococcus sp. AM001]|nr:restriction endonuclease [Myxococcus sp. AM001]
MELIKDWGGFEELIEKLNETGTVTVQRDVTLTGKSGAPRQIDVLVTHTEGLYKHTIIIECKFWKDHVKRAQIDAMVAAIEDLNASKGVFFTSKGYQSGAETMARSKGIDIFRIRELSEDEWGKPGRVIDIHLHTISRAIGNLHFPESHVATSLSNTNNIPPNLNLRIAAGPNGFESKTPITLPDNNTRHNTLEDLLNEASMEVVRRVTSKTVTFNKGTDCAVHFMGHVKAPFVPPMQIHSESEYVILAPALECDIGVRINQSRIRVDRGDKYLFALAVEDCVTGVTYAATRVQGEKISSLSALAPPQTSSSEEVLQNGSVLRVTLKGFFDFNEFNMLTSVPWPKEL